MVRDREKHGNGIVTSLMASMRIQITRRSWVDQVFVAQITTLALRSMSQSKNFNHFNCSDHIFSNSGYDYQEK